MGNAMLEHVNVTVSNPEKTAEMFCELFDWHIRWQGESMLGGRSVHVGNDSSYIALYTDTVTVEGKNSTYAVRGGLNHIGVVVEDLAEVERRVLAAGFKSHNHGDYEPGRRFYFDDHDGIEIEVVSYS